MLRRTMLFLLALSLGLAPLFLSPRTAQGLTGFSTPLVTNLADTSAVVTWVTDLKVPGGSVNFGLSRPPAPGRASENGVPGALGDVHSVLVPGLTASKVYYYSVSLGGYTDDNGGQYYSFTTGPALTFPVPSHTATGKVLKADGSSPAVGVVITLKVIDNNNLNSTTQSAALSSLTDSSGNWTITLNARTLDSSAVFNYPTNGANDFVQFSVTGGALGQVATQTVQMTFNANALNVGAATLAQGLATDTPTPITPTLTPTITFTNTPAPQPSATPSLTPATAPSPTTAPPTVAPSPTLPPSATPLAPAPVAVPPPEAPPVENPTDTPADSVPEVPAPAPPAPAAVLPTPRPSLTPTATVSVPTPRPVATVPSPAAPATLVPPRPFAIATSQDSTPAVSQTVRPVATADVIPAVVASDDLGPRPTIALLAGLALVVAGIAAVTVGVVNQMRES